MEDVLSRRDFLTISGASLASGASLCITSSASAQQGASVRARESQLAPRLNLVFFMPDEMRADSLSPMRIRLRRPQISTGSPRMGQWLRIAMCNSRSVAGLIVACLPVGRRVYQGIEASFTFFGQMSRTYSATFVKPAICLLVRQESRASGRHIQRQRDTLDMSLLVKVSLERRSGHRNNTWRRDWPNQ